MKYRIKRVEKKDGLFVYYPQYKRFFFWRYFSSRDNLIVKFTDLRTAKQFIDFDFAHREKNKIKNIYNTPYKPNKL